MLDLEKKPRLLIGLFLTNHNFEKTSFTNIIGLLTQICLNFKMEMYIMDLLAEREGFQYRIKSLEAQVQNLEQMIEDVDKEVDNKVKCIQEERRTEPSVCSFFDNSSTFSTNNSNNTAETEQELPSADSFFTDSFEVSENGEII
jgi:hypothetical protein